MTTRDGESTSEGLKTEAVDAGLNEAQEQSIQNTQSLNRDLGVGIERRKKINELEKKINEELGLRFEKAKASMKIQEDKLVQIQNELELLLEGKGTLEEQEKLFKSIQEANKEIADETGLSADLQQKINAELRKAEPDLKLIQTYYKQGRGELEQTLTFSNSLNSSFSKFSSKLGITANVADTGFGKMREFFIDLNTGNTDKKAEMLFKKIADFADPLNLAANLLGVLVDQAFLLESASISFSKATGFARDFDNQLIKVTSNINMAGGTAEEASAALQDLAKDFSSFIHLLPEAQEELATLNFRLKKIGVGNATKLFEIFNKNMKAGAEEVGGLTRELILSGTAAGITASEMSTNFETSFKRLALEGSQAVESFKDLAAQAKAAGIAVSDLTTMVKDFDTFDKGAEKAAKLNAILGTQISHMQMLNMSDEQRSREMIRQVKMAVGNFDALSRSEKLYIAQAIAGGDVAKAQRMINMSTAEYLEKKDKMAAAAKTQEQMKQLTETLVPVIDKLKLAFTQVALEMSPVIVAFTKVLNLISYLSPVIGALTVGFITYLAITKGAAAVLFLYTTITELATAVELAREAGLKGLAFFTEVAALMQIKFNFASMTSIGLIGALAAGIAYLIYTMTKPNSPPFFLIFGVVAFGIRTMSSALNTMSPKAMLAAVVLALLAAAVSLIFYGIGYVVEQMVAFVSVMAEAPLAFLSASSGIYLLAGAMGALATSTLLFRFDAFTNFANSMGNLGTGMEAYARGIERLKSVAGELSSVMGDTNLIGTTEGGKSTVIMGKNAGLASILNNDKLVIDVQMPEINFPTPIVNVYIDGVALSDAVMDVIMETR